MMARTGLHGELPGTLGGATSATLRRNVHGIAHRVGRGLACSAWLGLPALALLAATPAAAAAPAVGAAAPAFDLPGDAGRIRLDAYKGKLVYVDFWASWCGPCRKSFPWMNSLQQRYGAHGLQVVAINLDAKRADAAAFLAKVPAGFPVAYDEAGATPRAYGIKGMPSSALVGRDGKLLWLHAGFNESDLAMLDAQIKAALQLQ